MSEVAAFEPYYLEAGEGPGVVCLHSNASTSGQWRPLMDRLADTHHVLAPDTLGAGKGPPWPGAGTATLSDEVAVLEPVFERIGPTFSLVGHSYGAAIALIAALTHPGRVERMVLYEPTIFAVLKEEPADYEAFDDIYDVVKESLAALELDDTGTAAERFIDYWAGTGAWASIPEQRQAPVAASMVNIGGWSHALCEEPAGLDSFRSLDMPIRYLVGDASPISSRRVAERICEVLPQVELIELDGLGHMAPMTQPGAVNDLIADFLGNG